MTACRDIIFDFQINWTTR